MKSVPLKYLFKITGGGTPASSVPEYWDGEIKWFTPEDLSKSEMNVYESKRKISIKGLNNSSARLLPKGSLIMTCRAPIGNLALANDEFTTNQGCKGLVRKSDQVNVKFYYYVLTALKEKIQALGTGTTFTEISSSVLGNLKVPFPSLTVQNKIVSYLSEINAKISKAQEGLIEEKFMLQSYCSSLITQAVTKGLDPNVPMKDSGIEWLGEVPVHWSIIRLGTAATKMTNGYVGPTRDIFRTKGINYLQSLHIKNGKILFEKSPYFVDHEWSLKQSKSILKKGDLVIVQTGDIGQVASIPEEYENSNCHALIIVRLKETLGNGDYLSWYFQSQVGKESLLYYKTGALHPHLDTGRICNLKVLLPPLKEQQVIIKYLNEKVFRIDNVISKIELQIKRLEEYRSTLINAAVTGQIDVSNISMSDEEMLENLSQEVK